MEFSNIPSYVIQFVGLALFGLLIYIIARQIKRQEAIRQNRKNPRSLNINETIYNIDQRGIDQHREASSQQEARAQAQISQKHRKILSRKEFFQAEKLLKNK